MLLVVLIAFTGLLNPFPKAPAGESVIPEVRESAGYHLDYQLILLNEDSDKPVKGRLLLPIPQSNSPYQQVEGLYTGPEPAQTWLDSSENETAVFPMTIDPGCEKTVTLSFDVTSFHVSFPLRSMAGSKPALPVPVHSKPGSAFNPGLPGIGEIVTPICRDEDSQLYRLVKLYDFVRTNFTFREEPRPRTVEEVLKDRVLQCCDANVLFVSLCRASGIPAEFVGGVYVSKDREVFPQTHSWVRVYLDGPGWVPVDPTLGRFDSYTRYQCLGEQRRFYIEMWHGEPESAVFLPDGEEGRMPVMRLKMNLRTLVWEKKSAEGSKSRVPGPDRKTSGARAFEFYSRDAWRHYFAGFESELSEDYGRAIPEFEKAVRDSPSFVRAHRRLIKCAFLTGRGDEITGRYKRLFDSSPGDPLSKYYYALCLLHGDNYSRSEQLLHECEKEGFISTELYNSLGYLYLSTKQVARAEETFSRALSCRGDHFPVYENLMSMLQDEEEWERVVYWAERGLEEFPGNQVFLAQTGYGLIRLGKPDLALGYINSAIAANTKMGWYHALKGWALKELGNKDEARREIKTGIALKRGISNEKFYRDILEELDRK